MAAVEYAMILLAVVGIILLFFLCKKVPRLHRSGGNVSSVPHRADHHAKISVIIPTHNSAHEISALLADLYNQSLEPVDIICVDMQSTDDTVLIAHRLGALVLPFSRLPNSDISRGDTALAYQQGVSYARGDYFVFLQPDLRLSTDALASLACAYHKIGQPLSLRPYHMIRRPYENLALMVYYFGAFIKGIGLAGRRRDKNFSFFSDVLVFSRYHWEMFTSEVSQPPTLLPGVMPQQAYDADCTALQVAVAMMSPHDSAFRNAVMAHKSPRYYDDCGGAEPAAFSKTAVAGYAVDTEDLFAADNASAVRQSAEGNSYEWMRDRFMDQKVGLQVMLGSKLFRTRNYPDGFWRFFLNMAARVRDDRRSSAKSLGAMVFAAFIALCTSVFSIAYGAVEYNPVTVVIGIALYVTIAFLLYSKSRMIGSYHPIMFVFFPAPLLFYLFSGVASFFISESEKQNSSKKHGRNAAKKKKKGASYGM